MPRYRPRRPVPRALVQRIPFPAPSVALVSLVDALFIPIRTLAPFAHVHLETVALVHASPVDVAPYLTGASSWSLPDTT